MLIEVPLEELYCNDETLDLRVESINSDNRRGEKESVREVISKDIRIQIALADIVLKNFEDDIDNAVSFVLMDYEKDSKLLDQLHCIFKSVNIICCGEENLAYEVCSPTEEATAVFQEALLQKNMNKWIEVFYSDRNAEDCDRIGLYKYCGKMCGIKEIAEMYSDAFFNYHLMRTGNPLIQSGFPVSQYRMDEIEEIPYIDEIFSVVENLYIIVSKVDNMNGETYYEKLLTWDALKNNEQLKK